MKFITVTSRILLVVILATTTTALKGQSGDVTVTQDKSVWGKNIIYTPQPPPAVPRETTNLGEQPKDMVKQITYLDAEVLPGAYYTETSWLRTAYPDKVWVTEHAHDWDEVFGLYGSDPDNPYELNGEIELWIDGEQHLITKSCLIFIPKGVKHCPLILRRIDKPIFFFTTGPSKDYSF